MICFLINGMLLCYWCVVGVCCCGVVTANVSPPLVLVASAPVLLLTVPSNVLGKAIAPIHHCGVAEPELLLRGLGGMHAGAASICMLCAALDVAPSMSIMFPLAVLELKGPPDGKR